MRLFLEFTAWPMERPKAYGTFHLSFFFIGLAVCFLLAFLLRKANEKQNKIILLSVGIFLALTEIYKQLFYYFVIEDGHYPLWIFPFQLCSIPMYFCIFVPLIKNEKVKNACYNFLLAFNLMSGFISFLEPSGLLHEYVTLTLHAFIWHMTLVFVGSYLGFSKRAGQNLKDFNGAFIVFLIVCVLAFLIDIILYPLGEINMFFISPFVRSPIIVFKSIYQNFGWIVNDILFIFSLCLGAFVFFMMFFGINRMLEKRKVKYQTKHTYSKA